MQFLSPVCSTLLLLSPQGEATRALEFPACLAKASGALGSEGYKLTHLAYVRWRFGRLRPDARVDDQQLETWAKLFGKGIRSKSPQVQFFSIRALLDISEAGHAIHVPTKDVEPLVTGNDTPISEQALYLAISLRPGTRKRCWELNKMLARLEKRHRSAPRLRSMLSAARLTLMERGAALRLNSKTLPAKKQGPINDNESDAISVLKNLSSSQAQVQASGVIDCNINGAGEYGFFQELAGSRLIRKFDPQFLAARKDAKVPQRKMVKPAVLAPKFGQTDTDGCLRYNGYYFRIYLPGPGARWLHENGPKDDLPLASPGHAEVLWCAYAWPVERGVTGNRTFFVTQAEDIFSHSSGPMGYSGKKRIPSPYSGFFIQLDRKNPVSSKVGVPDCAFDGGRWRIIG